MARGRKFVHASDLLQDLLDRYEQGVARPVGYPDYSGFSDVNAGDAFSRAVEAAERSGGVVRVHNAGRRHGELKLVRLADAPRLYEHLGRIPSRQAASAIGEEMLSGLVLHPAIRETALAAVEAWSRNRRWSYLGIEDAMSMRNAVRLAQAIIEQQHLNLDYRTFSRRIVADSKVLEGVEGAVLQLVRAAVQNSATEAAG